MILNISIDNDWLTIIGIASFFIVASLVSNMIDKNRLQHRVKEIELSNHKNVAELKVKYQEWALKEFEKFKEAELTAVIKMAREQSLLLLEQWKIDNEIVIRQDAINRSYSVSLGKIAEQLMPFHISFPFNPNDTRFIGSPIDLIVFDGDSENKDEISIYIIEVKTGKSGLTKTQKKIRDAVEKNRVHWLEINPANQFPTIQTT